VHLSETSPSSPRLAMNPVAGKPQAEGRALSPRLAMNPVAGKPEAETQLAAPRLTVKQINIVGNPEAERHVMMVQTQMVCLEADIQNQNRRFQEEARAANKGRAHDRDLFERAYRQAEMYFEQVSENFANHCRTFLHQEVNNFSQKQKLEKDAYLRLKEHEVQKVREVEMNARAATNTEASVNQRWLQMQDEAWLLHQETQYLKHHQEVLTKEMQQATNESNICRLQLGRTERYATARIQFYERQVMDEAGDARWRDECHLEVCQQKQQCQEAQLEALATQRRVLHLEQRSEEQAKHHRESMLDLRGRMEHLANEHALAVAEQQMARTTNQWLQESERQALNKAAELSHKETAIHFGKRGLATGTYKVADRT